MGSEKMEKKVDINKVNEAIGLVCNQKLGVLDSSFLCQSLGALNPARPISVPDTFTVGETLAKLSQARVGCVLITSEDGKLVGIFSERDCMLKVIPSFEAATKLPITAMMTPDPVTQTIDCTVGFALTLMSEGGFRHIPIVDADGIPTAIISVKNLMDYIVSKFIDDVLAFEPSVE